MFFFYKKIFQFVLFSDKYNVEKRSITSFPFENTRFN